MIGPDYFWVRACLWLPPPDELVTRMCACWKKVGIQNGVRIENGLHTNSVNNNVSSFENLWEFNGKFSEAGVVDFFPKQKKEQEVSDLLGAEAKVCTSTTEIQVLILLDFVQVSVMWHYMIHNQRVRFLMMGKITSHNFVWLICSDWIYQ